MTRQCHRVVTLRWFDGDTLKRDGEVLKVWCEALHGDKEAFKRNRDALRGHKKAFFCNKDTLRHYEYT